MSQQGVKRHNYVIAKIAVHIKTFQIGKLQEMARETMHETISSSYHYHVDENSLEK